MKYFIYLSWGMLTHLHVNYQLFCWESVGASILFVCFVCLLVGLKKKSKTFEKIRRIVCISEIPSQIIFKTPIHPSSRCYP